MDGITMDGILLVVVSKIKHRTYENLNIFTIKTEIIKMSRDKMSRKEKVTKFEYIYVYHIKIRYLDQLFYTCYKELGNFCLIHNVIKM